MSSSLLLKSPRILLVTLTVPVTELRCHIKKDLSEAATSCMTDIGNGTGNNISSLSSPSSKPPRLNQYSRIRGEIGNLCAACGVAFLGFAVFQCFHVVATTQRKKSYGLVV